MSDPERKTFEAQLSGSSICSELSNLIVRLNRTRHVVVWARELDAKRPRRETASVDILLALDASTIASVQGDDRRNREIMRHFDLRSNGMSICQTDEARVKSVIQPISTDTPDGGLLLQAPKLGLCRDSRWGLDLSITTRTRGFPMMVT